VVVAVVAIVLVIAARPRYTRSGQGAAAQA